MLAADALELHVNSRCKQWFVSADHLWSDHLRRMLIRMLIVQTRSLLFSSHHIAWTSSHAINLVNRCGGSFTDCMNWSKTASVRKIGHRFTSDWCKPEVQTPPGKIQQCVHIWRTRITCLRTILKTEDRWFERGQMWKCRMSKRDSAVFSDTYNSVLPGLNSN